MKNSTKLLALSTAGMVILLLSTDPNNLSSALLVVPFLLLFVILYLVMRRIFKDKTSSRSGIVMLVAGLAIIALALQSLGQLTPRDGIMLLILFMIGYFYIYRRTTTPT